MDNPLGYPFAVKMGQLLHEMHVLNQDGPRIAGGEGIQVVIHRCAEIVS
jgi:hypothetical protein